MKTLKQICSHVTLLKKETLGKKTLKCTYLLKYNPIRAGPCQEYLIICFTSQSRLLLSAYEWLPKTLAFPCPPKILLKCQNQL